MWQEISIVLIGIATVAYVGHKLYSMLATRKNKDQPCYGCTGCTLKKELSREKHPQSHRGSQHKCNL